MENKKSQEHSNEMVLAQCGVGKECSINLKKEIEILKKKENMIDIIVIDPDSCCKLRCYDG